MHMINYNHRLHTYQLMTTSKYVVEMSNDIDYLFSKMQILNQSTL